ncbi:MAG: iron-sulfur cluster-binding protein [Deltaproteobacteria bacterium]|nr:iron-sulfur cluster-binding protein [Deltaproteobacteria bacterium]
MSSSREAITFRANVQKALRDPMLREAIKRATDTFVTKRTEGIASLPMEEWREKASTIRMKVLDNLPQYVEQFCASAERAGAKVYQAVDAESARRTVAGILEDRGVKKVVKAKSMVTEEIHLNPCLQERGIDVLETDLGEYIVQLAAEAPSHILAPAIHKTREQIGKLFAEKLGVDYSDDPTVLTRVARNVLRTEFLTADAGITGANFAVADTGSLVIFTNEGNGRMVTTVPRLHVAVLTIEKLLPSVTDLPSFVRLLPRSATGQMLSSYVSVITGPRKPGDFTGADELHIVLLDNGRWEILKGEYREILKCIRCSACLNVCPVYRAIGGHAYDSTYPGPMGIVLTALLEGMERAHPVLDATTLCGACVDACPVKVPLVRLLCRLREASVEEGFAPLLEKRGMSAYGAVVSSPVMFAFGQTLARIFWPFAQKLSGYGPMSRIPRPVARAFRRRML